MNKWKILFASLLLIITTALVLMPALDGEILNWDDAIYLEETPSIQALNWKNTKEIFTSFVMGNYHPLTVLSYAIEYKFVGWRPFLFHLDNLILHILNTLLVFGLIYRLTKGAIGCAFVTALLFGIHPMHVESVAWISERKDLLYVFFTLLALISYLSFLDKDKKKHFFFTLFLFILALLSKAQAVVLAPLLVLIDYLKGRKLEKNTILEKVPFFLIALSFGLLAIKAQKFAGAVNQVKVEFYKPFFIANYGLLNYLARFIAPLKLSALHPYPFGANGSLPLYVYLSPLLSAAILFALYTLTKSSKRAQFGFFFFIICILPVIQFLPVGQAAFAERYTYFAYIGLFLLVADYCFSLNRKWVHASLVLYLSLMGFMSFNRSSVWKDSVSLWTDVMEKYPSSITPYGNRGYAYMFQGKEDLAGKDFDRGIELDPKDLGLRLNRAQYYRTKRMWDKAIEEYTNCISIAPNDFRAYAARGELLSTHKRNFAAAIKDFDEALKYMPNYNLILINKGLAYLRDYEPEKAIEVFDLALTKEPNNYQIYAFRAEAYGQAMNFEKALNDAILAEKNGFRMDSFTLREIREKLAQQSKSHEPNT